jgi:hypothetical protein
VGNFQLAYTVHAAPEGPVLYCKGAPEVVLALDATEIVFARVLAEQKMRISAQKSRPRTS